MSPISSSIDDLSNSQVEPIWNPDIEQSFLEALAIYPPCGRRKIILTADGKVYGRNELVARYIKIRTGKIRTRKQVSSHLQVLMKRRSKELQLLREDKQAQEIILERLRQSSPIELQMKMNDEKHIYPTDSEFSSTSNSESDASISSIQNLLTPSIHIESFELNKTNHSTIGSQQRHKSLQVPIITNQTSPSSFATSPRLSPYGLDQSRCSSSHSVFSMNPSTTPFASSSSRQSLFIGDETFHLLDLYAFIESKQTSQSSMSQHNLIRFDSNDNQINEMQNFERIFIDQIADKFDGLKNLFDLNPHGSFFLIKFWADVTFPTVNSIGNADQSFFTSYRFRSSWSRPIFVSTRVLSFGKQIFEKVEVIESPQLNLFDEFIYQFDRSPLHYYIVEFIQKLCSLSNRSSMNDVLENFTMFQVIKSCDGAQKLLLCLAFAFEVSMFDNGGPQYQIYKLVSS